MKQVFRLLAVLIGLNLLASVIIITSIWSWLYQRTQLDEAQAVQEKYHTLYISLSDLESAQRGYVITGSDGYLRAYNQNKSLTEQVLAQVEQAHHPVVSDTTQQNIVRLSRQKIAEMQATLDTRRREGFEAASTQITSHLSENLMTENKLLIDQAIKATNNEQDARRVLRSVSSGVAFATLIVNLLATIGAALSTYRLFQRMHAVNSELVTVSRSKDEFLALASHQLRTPATAVKQYLSLALDGVVGDLTPSQKAMVEKAWQSNERQISIVNDILKVAKLDLNTLKLDRSLHSMNTVVTQAIDGTDDNLEALGHSLSFRRSKASAKVLVDEPYIRSVIENLIDNAVKYSPPNNRIDVQVLVEDNEILVSVSDEGVGIPMEDQPRLFQKFSRIENPLSVSAGGTGLGLYWCKEIVELHGGSISLDSAVGQGSTFTVHLPRYVAQKRRDAAT